MGRFETADVEKTQGVLRERDHHTEEARAALDYMRRNSDDCNEAQRPMSDDEIVAEVFKYHPPTGATLPKHAAINQAAKFFAEVILANCPRGADRADAIRKIREARMTANAAVALNGLSLY